MDEFAAAPNSLSETSWGTSVLSTSQMTTV